MEQKKIVAIVEARMTSSRLPGKHMLEANGKPMLQHLIERLKRVSCLDDIVIATPDNSADDILEQLAIKNNVGIYRGSELDVMDRVLKAAEAYSADIICEVSGDCPIIDPVLIEHLIQTFLNNNVSYIYNGAYGLPGGMAAQIFYYQTLKYSSELTQAPLDREHVTLHIRNNPELFSQFYLVAPKDLDYPDLMLLLDEEDDYKLLKKVIEHFGDCNPGFSCFDIINLIKNNPEWLKINYHVTRKGDA